MATRSVTDCSICGYDYEDGADLKNHYIEEHPDMVPESFLSNDDQEDE